MKVTGDCCGRHGHRYHHRSKKWPFFSRPIIAKSPSEEAVDEVKLNPSALEPEKVPVAIAFLKSAEKFVGSVGSSDPGV